MEKLNGMLPKSMSMEYYGFRPGGPKKIIQTIKMAWVILNVYLNKKQKMINEKKIQFLLDEKFVLN